MSSMYRFLFVAMAAFVLQACDGEINTTSTYKTNGGNTESTASIEIESTSLVVSETEEFPAEIPDLVNHFLFFGQNDKADYAVMTDVNGEHLRLLSGGNWGKRSSRFSPDGQQIAFAEYSTQASMGQALYVMDVNGENQRLLLESSPDESSLVLGFSWSPDGSQIAFMKSMSNTGPLYVLDVATGSVSKLVDANVWGEMKWSPDGSQIAFLARQVDSSGKQIDRLALQVVDIDGQNLRQFISAEYSDTDHVRSFEWSPDGTRIAFFSELFSVDAEEKMAWEISELYILDINNDVLTQFAYEGKRGYSPVWGADGGWLYFLVADEGKVDINRAVVATNDLNLLHTLILDPEDSWYALNLTITGDKLVVYSYSNSRLGLLNLDGSGFVEVETDFEGLSRLVWIGGN